MRYFSSTIISLSILVSGFTLALPALASALPLDSNGWTIFTPSGDTRTVYVSNSTGNDSNSGLTQSAPVKTISKGKSLLRNGFPDWLLLKKGDTWTNEGLGNCVSGRSASEPMLISAYGSGARPLIKTGSGANGYTAMGGSSCGSYMAITGLEFYSYQRDPANPSFSASGVSSETVGIFVLNATNYVLIEDNKFSFYGVNLVVEPVNGTYSANWVLRRNVIVDAYNTSGHAQGIFAQDVTNLSLIENFFDHNGWNATVSGGQATIFNHNWYIGDDELNYRPVTYTGNISLNDPSGGQGRTGGWATDNFFAYDPESTNFVNNNNANVFSNNVVINANDIPQGGGERGTGVNIIRGPQAGGTMQVNNNIFANSVSSGSGGNAINFQDNPTGITVSNNIIFKWANGIVGAGSGNTITNNAIDLAGNNTAGYVNPNRSLATYDATIGGPGTQADFIARARAQRKDNWNPALTAYAVNTYIRAGFATGGGDTQAPTTPANLTGSAVSSSQINLSWNASSDNVGVTGYRIYRGGTLITTVTGTSYSNTGLSPSTAYSYYVRAIDAAGNVSGNSNTASATTQAGGGTAPTVNISANPTSVSSGGSSTLTWSSTNATSCNASGGWSGSKATSGSQSLTNLTSTATYTLTCTGTGGSANNSATVTVTGGGGGTITIGETTVFSDSDGGNGNLLLVQDVNLPQTATIQSLSFYVNTAGGNLSLGIYDATGPSGGPGALKAQISSFTPVVGWNTRNVITPVSLPAGNYWLAYFPSSNNLAFAVNRSIGSFKYASLTYGSMPATFPTVNGSGTAHWSLYATLSTAPVGDTTPPSTPANLSASAVSSSQINLSWSASTDNIGVTGYRVFRGGTQVGTPTGTSYSDTGLTASTAYSYYVRAVDAAGNVSGNSNTASATTLPVTAGFAIGDRMVTTSNLNVRATPSTSGTLLGTQVTGSLGLLVGGPTIANGYIWWNVNYDTGADGWSVQDYIAKTTPAPTASLSANPTSITSGQSSTLSWTSTNATSCTASGGWSGAKATSGTQSVSPTVTTTYSITCTGTGGTSPSSNAVVTVSSASAWVNTPFASQSGIFTASFDAIPLQNNEDTVIGLSSGAAAAYNDLAAIVRFYSASVIDARNGDTYGAAVSVPYTAGISYHFREVVNVPAHTYSVYVTPQGQSEVPLASNYAFRTEQATVATLANLGKYNLVSNATVTNLIVSAADTTAPTTPTNLSGSGISPSQINLTWTASTDNVGVTGYKIFRNGTQVGTSPSTSFSSTGLSASTVYSYTVSAYDAASNNSAQSAATGVITLGAGAPAITTGSRVVTIANLNVRSSASASATKLGTESIGSLGTVIGGPTNAGGHTWWQVNYDNAISGWSIGDYLGAAAAASSPAVGMAEPAQGSLTLIQQLLQQVQSLSLQLQSLQSQVAGAGAATQ